MVGKSPGNKIPCTKIQCKNNNKDFSLWHVITQSYFKIITNSQTIIKKTYYVNQSKTQIYGATKVYSYSSNKIGTVCLHCYSTIIRSASRTIIVIHICIERKYSFVRWNYTTYNCMGLDVIHYIGKIIVSKLRSKPIKQHRQLSG